MLKLIFTALIVSLNHFQVELQSIKTGGCAYIPSVPNFSLYKFTGQWYDIASIPIPAFKLGKCVLLNCIIDYSGMIRISVNYYDGKQIQQFNNAFTINNASGVYFVQVPMINLKFEFIVVDTDYNNYSVIYACAKLTTLKIQLIWVLSRQSTLSQDIYSNITSTLKRRKLPYKKLKTRDTSSFVI
ncbi:apolipoprotein D-like [Chironomus tepperi]|uniref:apolipoprotein D-like n=1 Tax=Chironomus tepperi TaxID=113505 RepID=UPI00391F72FE